MAYAQIAHMIAIVLAIASLDCGFKAALLSREAASVRIAVEREPCALKQDQIAWMAAAIRGLAEAGKLSQEAMRWTIGAAALAAASAITSGAGAFLQ